MPAMTHYRRVAFLLERFAFQSAIGLPRSYLKVIDKPQASAKAAPVETNCKENVMKFLARLFAASETSNLIVAIERKRLAETMPGQTGAVAAARLGHTIG